MDQIRITGELKIEVYNVDGSLADERRVRNLVTAVGKSVIAARLGSATPAFNIMSYMGVGASSTAAASGDTALGAEIAGSRTALTSTTVSGNQVQYICTFPAGVGTGSITEAGLFDAANTGNMLAHAVFNAVVKGSTQPMTVTWTVTLN